MRWFQALLPREDSFFDQFEAHARLLVQGAEALRDLLNGGAGVAAACAAIVRHEEAADEITRACSWPSAAPSSPPSTAATSAT